MRDIRKAAALSGLFALMILAASCGTTDPTPVGIDLIDRSGGAVIEIPSLPLLDARSRFDGLRPTRLGLQTELMVGRMNGVELRTLVQVSVAATSLGASGLADVAVDSIRLEMRLASNAQRGQGPVAAAWTDHAWTEESAFVDSTTFTQIPVTTETLAGNSYSGIVDSTLFVTLPGSYWERAATGNPPSGTVRVALVPAPGTSDFLSVVRSREDSLGFAPQARIFYTRSGVPAVYATPFSADIYYAERVEAPGTNVYLLETGVFYSTLLKFDLPDTIPQNGTINAGELTFDVLSDQSLFGALRVEIDRIDVAGADTSFNLPTTGPLGVQEFTSTQTRVSFPIDRFMIQGWTSGALTNHGLALRPQFSTVRYEWAALANPRLRLIYSLPPEVD